ncbi:hypothetical protein [Isachenkonia alkalipeptolytica]|uniref:ParB/Sulfiredoxin domain-containing protein n=1 Tax=Isachenkonia alkalipeptolytica TaxID=2565777 RepID=A0AA43XJQ8_9CLOT|nr:hypothetical protein [Isachenkonia alkalipeptolytica]NBG88118.1 hypothetical protein [Isachenkonia alkalipeptolytica]
MVDKKVSRKLKVSANRKNYVVEPGDEYLQNGIFIFHITKLNEFIDQFPEKFQVVEIDVHEYHKYYCNGDMNPDYIKSANLKRPVLLAEIAPDRLYHGYPSVSKDYFSRGYNLIDGHHRLAKAKQEGQEHLKAYLIPMEQHIDFICEGFDTYVEYWNSKLE